MKPTYIIAEIAQGFEGDPGLCKRFIKLAKDCGAEAVKFQIFKVDEICTPDYKHYNLFKSLEIDPVVWSGLIDYADQIGIDFISDIFGTKTLEWISKTKIKGYKIHSTDIRNYDLLNALKDCNYLIILSTGGSLLEEVKTAIERLGENKIILMSGFQAEPNLLNDIELDKIYFLKNKFNLEVGYADHIDPLSPLAVVLPSMAVLKGATYIEKHLTAERDDLKLEDFISALNPGEFKAMCRMIRDVEQFTEGNKEYKLSERETLYRKNTKRTVLAKNKIEKGKVIDRDNLTLLRTGKPVKEILDIEFVIGKTALKDFIPEEVITNEFLK